jgi:hypothetical protein
MAPKVPAAPSGLVLAPQASGGAATFRAIRKGVFAYVAKKGKFITPAQIDWAIDLMKSISEQAGITTMVIGGVAMQAYGSPRLTKDIDFVVDQAFEKPEVLSVLGPINFGGMAYIAADGAKIDAILRNDEYKPLYDEALAHLVFTEDEIPIVTPDYLAAMEFAANEPKHMLDLQWLVKQPGLLDLAKVRNLIYRHVGAKFGTQTFERLVDQVELERRRKPGGLDPCEYP